MVENSSGMKFYTDDMSRELTEDELMNDIKDDYQEDDIEDEQEIKDEINSEGYTPEPEKDLSPIAFLERNLDKEDKISVSNLTVEELGKPTLPIRFWRQYASIFDGLTLYNMPLVYQHILRKAKINESTSLSREAKALELAITNKRVRERKANQSVDKFLDYVKRKSEGQQ